MNGKILFLHPTRVVLSTDPLWTIDRDRIAKYVKFLAKRVAEEMDPDEVPIFVGILNGSFMFAADFIREYPYDCHITFVKMASYDGINSSGKIKHLVGINEDLNGNNETCTCRETHFSNRNSMSGGSSLGIGVS